MLTVFSRKLKRFCSRLGWPIRRRSKPKIVIKKFGKTNSRTRNDANASNTIGSAVIYPSNESGGLKSKKPICVATFNAALFSMAPAVPEMEKSASFEPGNEGFLKKKNAFEYDLRAKSMNDRPKSILKQSPLRSESMSASENLSKQQKFAKSRLRVSINLPDNEISLKKSGHLGFSEGVNDASSVGSSISRALKGKAPLTYSKSTSLSAINGADYRSFRSTRTVLDVLRELNADILALQDVKAEEEKEMKPLSDLAKALGMNYVFAESWAPEYGNAILSKWPIKKWKAQKIFDETDFRNVLKATIDVPQVGEIDFFCTHLDHLDENWRMKQINAIIQSTNIPHILAGGLNSLDETDYSRERWTDIVKYYEEMGKPTPKVEVMKYLKSEKYTDAKDFAGECESVVMIAKGQNVQGTCKYGTRVDYILSSPNAAYKFVPGSYSVFSSKGTSDHHIVKVDLVKVDSNPQQQYVHRKGRQSRQRIVKITHSSSPSKGIWKTQS
ncbi:DNAse I-like superfamily protein [Forsythia ovata]|uniref:DNAse I-like superfamily protein n=1 Tax=Forsythia ovata TaxID=205694 RepID=A0ABD1VE25_9LAMI